MTQVSSLRPLWKCLFGLFVVLCVSPAGAQELSDEDYMRGFKPRLTTIDRQAAGARALTFDEKTFSVAALVSDMGPRADAQNMYFFVRDKIAFEPYSGARRGLVATLMARSGNSVDQTLLLREMLATRRIKTRIVTGTLDKEASLRLLRSFVGEAELKGPMPAKKTLYRVERDRALRAAVEDHTWLEAYIDGKWVHMDPTFPRAVYGVPVGTKVSDSDDVPESVKINLTIKLFVEERNGGGGEMMSVTRPLKNLAHRNLVLRFEEFDRSGELRTPILRVGNDLEKGRRFRWPGLSRLWVEFTFDRGGRVREQVVRELHLGAAQTSVVNADQQVFSLMVLPSWLPDDFLRVVARQELPSLAASSRSVLTTLERDFRKAALESEVGPQFAGYIESVLGEAAGVVALSHANVMDQVTVQLAARHGVRAFYQKPRVLIVTGVRKDDRLYWQFDMRQNDIGAVPAEGLPVQMAHAFQAARGRFESDFQSAVLTGLTGKSSLATSRVFKAASKGRVPLVTLSTANVDTTLATLKISEQARERLEHSIRQLGHVALVPERPVSIGDFDALSWWELDAAGAIIGAGEDGAHGSSQFNSATLARTTSGAQRAGSQRVLVFDEALTLTEKLTTNVVKLVKSTPNVCPVMCGVGADLPRIPGRLCADAKERPPTELQACFEPASGGDDLLGIRQTCAARVRPAACGALVAHAVLSGSHSVVYKTRPASNTTGPWDPDLLPQVLFSSCNCR